MYFFVQSSDSTSKSPKTVTQNTIKMKNKKQKIKNKRGRGNANFVGEITLKWGTRIKFERNTKEKENVSLFLCNLLIV